MTEQVLSADTTSVASLTTSRGLTRQMPESVSSGVLGGVLSSLDGGGARDASALAEELLAVDDG